MVVYWKDNGTLGCVPFGEDYYDTIEEHEPYEHDLSITVLYYYIGLHEPANLTTSAFVVRVGFLATMSNIRWHTPVCFQKVRILLRVRG